MHPVTLLLPLVCALASPVFGVHVRSAEKYVSHPELNTNAKRLAAGLPPLPLKYRRQPERRATTGGYLSYYNPGDDEAYCLSGIGDKGYVIASAEACLNHGATAMSFAVDVGQRGPQSLLVTSGAPGYDNTYYLGVTADNADDAENSGTSTYSLTLNPFTAVNSTAVHVEQSIVGYAETSIFQLVPTGASTAYNILILWVNSGIGDMATATSAEVPTCIQDDPNTCSQFNITIANSGGSAVSFVFLPY